MEIIFKLYSVQIIKKNHTAFQKCWKWKLGEAGGDLKVCTSNYIQLYI